MTLVITSLRMFIKSAKNILKTHQKEFISSSILLAGIYPVISCSSCISLMVPTSYYLCDAISQLCFIFGAYQIYGWDLIIYWYNKLDNIFIFVNSYSLCLSYIGGETNFTKNQAKVFSYRRPPCCCLICFSDSRMTKLDFNLKDKHHQNIKILSFLQKKIHVDSSFDHSTANNAINHYFSIEYNFPWK